MHHGVAYWNRQIIRRKLDAAVSLVAASLRAPQCATQQGSGSPHPALLPYPFPARAMLRLAEGLLLPPMHGGPELHRD